MLDDYKILKKATQDLCDKLAQLERFQAKALLFSKRLQLKGLKTATLGNDYLFIPTSDNGLCLAFHFGALVFFNTTDTEVAQLCSALSKHTEDLFDSQLTEEIDVRIKPTHIEGVFDDKIQIRTCTTEHLEIIASALAKSIKLDQFEKTVAAAFEKVEPIALKLKNKGKLDQSASQLLKHIGSSLLTEHEMIGRIEVLEKPNVLWEHAELEPLYAQLIEEFEITERQDILDKKIELLARTAQTSLEVLQHRHASRLEWYIIILIMVSIVIEVLVLFSSAH